MFVPFPFVIFVTVSRGFLRRTPGAKPSGRKSCHKPNISGEAEDSKEESAYEIENDSCDYIGNERIAICSLEFDVSTHTELRVRKFELRRTELCASLAHPHGSRSWNSIFFTASIDSPFPIPQFADDRKVVVSIGEIKSRLNDVAEDLAESLSLIASERGDGKIWTAGDSLQTIQSQSRDIKSP